MKLSIHASVTFDLPQSVLAFLQLEAASLSTGEQTIDSAELSIAPYASAEPFLDFYGNPCRRLSMPQGQVDIDYKALVTIQDKRYPLPEVKSVDALHLPPETMLYLLPSRFCESDKLFKMATDLFSSEPQAAERVNAICRWIHANITYQYGVSTAETTATDTILQRAGVCRDFAHLGIALCRALEIPARYVSGYCLGLEPPDFHAYFQAFIGDRWISYDATYEGIRPALVQIAVGRDAADCAWSMLFGQGKPTNMSVQVTEANSS